MATSSLGVCLGGLLGIAAVLSSLPTFLAEFRPHVVETQLLWEPQVVGDVAAFRIPVAARLPNGTLVALAEARKFSSGDYGAKFLALRMSHPDKFNGDGAGDLWTPTQFIVDDFQAKDGLNLGAVIVDEVKNTLIVLYTVCAHTACPERDYVRSNYMLRSRDWGLTWERPVDISSNNAALKNLSWSAGPGYGIQKKYAPYKDRLIACGHTNDLNILSMFCIVSDDHGDTWAKAGVVYHIPYRSPLGPGDFAPTEVQIVELYNGTVLFNVRNERRYHCSCRIVMSSDDGANTIPVETIRFNPTLIDPVCAGSILLHGSRLYFTNPANEAHRQNLTLRWSADWGDSWVGALVVDPGTSEYSCLTAIDDNHVGIVYEQGLAGVWFIKVKLNS
ncbi:sialidase-1-like [Acanthaster planci]|uniref:Sialidase-1 n=1 Tax=Acanthaster planci TaxID=133434 RepID=A0A8B7Y4Q1_ACAPL|nr:sialidase-1-like [Acanthaster planci]